MKRLPGMCVVACCTVAGLCAGPAEEAIIAAMKLSDQPNYGWTATVVDDARTYEIEGRTVRGGFTRVRMPLVNSVRRKLGRSVTDTQVEMVFRGNVACVIETENGWKKPDELPPPPTRDDEFGHLAGATGHAPLIGGRGPPGSVVRGSIIPFPTTPPRRPEAPTPYSNLQLAISHPHEELGVIVSNHTEFRVEEEVATGRLTDLGAQLLLVHDGQHEISPLRAGGIFKLWLRSGHVVKYQVRLEGILSVEGPTGRREIFVQQTTSTDIKNVGTTVFDVPDEARMKLRP